MSLMWSAETASLAEIIDAIEEKEDWEGQDNHNIRLQT
jgi:predicted transcriptional regulator